MKRLPVKTFKLKKIFPYIFRKYLARLEKRMIFAKYSIEKSYLLHEIGRAHLLQSRFDECCSCARKAVEGKREKLFLFLL